jgi:DNA-binding IclR family transcriptional regulator
MANSGSGESVTQRLMRVLETFTPERSALSPAEIGRRAGLPTSTAYRLVDDLVREGLLERDDDARIRIGLRLWELTTRSSYVLALRQAALPHMERVQDVISEHTQLVVLEQDDALCVERLSAPEAGENITLVAGRLPLHASSSGLVLLAFGGRALQRRVLESELTTVSGETVTNPTRLSAVLAQIRRDDHVVTLGTVSEVSTGVAVPVRDSTGEVIAALSVILPRGADPAPALGELRAAAPAITRTLGARP